MDDKEFAEMLEQIIEEEERRLQVGSASFVRRDQEIMEMIDRVTERKVI